MKSKIVPGAVVLVLVFLDQWTKYLAAAYLKGNAPIVILKNVFELSYLENRGAAFGIFQNQRWIFLILTFVIMMALLYLYGKLPAVKRYLPMRGCLIVVFAGALGNMIDRMINGYVVDFFYFKLIDFPVFNVADVYVTVTVIVAVFLFLFYYEEEEFWELMKQNR